MIVTGVCCVASVVVVILIMDEGEGDGIVAADTVYNVPRDVNRDVFTVSL